MGQPEHFTLRHGGRDIVVELGEQAAESRHGGGRAPGAGQWFLTIGGTALTALPAHPDESVEDLHARVHRWLEANAGLLDRDQINLGGG